MPAMGVQAASGTPPALSCLPRLKDPCLGFWLLVGIFLFRAGLGIIFGFCGLVYPHHPH
jgi:hypothetical protein